MQSGGGSRGAVSLDEMRGVVSGSPADLLAEGSFCEVPQALDRGPMDLTMRAQFFREPRAFLVSPASADGLRSGSIWSKSEKRFIVLRSQQ